MAAVIGALRADLSASIAQFQQDMGKAADSVSRLSKRFKKIGGQMQSVGKSMSLGVSASIAGFAALTLKAAGDFEQGMNQVQAVSGATGEELEKLREQAKKMGATTQFSASQAADAMGFLAMAGFSADETMKALPGTLELAASAQMDLGRAADIVSNVLSGYGKDVKELGHVNDVLVKTFTSTNTSLEQIGEAMKMAGPVAASAGVQFEEAAAAVGLMGNAGIQASMAGTSLRGAISRILNPTKQVKDAMAQAGLQFTDAQGKLLPLSEIIRQLEPHAENTGLMMQLFGQRAGPAMAALVSQGSGALTGLTQELENSGGTAEKISKAQMKGFNGAMRELRSAFEALQIAIAESGLIDWVTKAVKAVTDWIQAVSKSSPQTLKWATIIAGLVATIGPVVAALGMLVSGIGAVAPAITAVIPVIAGLGKVLVGLVAASGPIGLVIAAVSAVVAIWSNWDKIGPIVANMVKAVVGWLKDKLGAVLNWVGDKISAVTGWFGDMYDAVVGGSYVPDMVDGIAKEFGRLDGVMVSPAEDAASRVGNAFRETGRDVGRALDQLVRTGELSFDSLRSSAANLAEDLFIKPFISKLGGGGQGGGIFQQLAGGLLKGFAGGFASGGTIPAGQWGIAGEHGPEPVFAGSKDMTVLPNSAMGGGMTQNFYISTPDANSFRSSQRQVARQAKQRMAL